MSGVFDLDTEGAAALDEQARLNPLDPSKLPPPMWAGAGQSLKGLLRPSAAAGRSLLLAAPSVLEVLGTGLTDEGKDWYFKNVVDELGSDAIDAWTPDPTTMGSAAKVLNIGTNVAGSIPQMIGAPGLFLTGAGIDPATELVRQGVDSNTAMGVGAVSLAVNAAGMRLPAAFGSTLTARVATGAGSNLALGAAADATSDALLTAGGYEQAAASYDAADPYARGLDLLMGAAFGWKAHIDAPRVMTPSQRDAVLVAKNNDHLQRVTLPGEPVNAQAARDNAAAVEQALRQLAAGEKVDVAALIDPAAYRLPAAAVSSPARESTAGYVAYRRALESGGRADARAPTSSATGIDQFTEGTWRSMVAKEKPAWAQGLEPQQILDARLDPAKSGEMAAALDRDNAAALTAAGQPVTQHSLYAAHHFGTQKGVRFAQAADNTPMAEILTTAQLNANAYLKGKTKAQAIANWDGRAAAAGIKAHERVHDTVQLADEHLVSIARDVDMPEELARQLVRIEEPVPRRPAVNETPLYDMSPDQIMGRRAAIKESETELENRILGERAEEYRKSIREANSLDDSKARAAVDRQLEIEQSLSPTDRNELLGIGVEDARFDEAVDYRKAAEDADVANAGEAAERLGFYLGKIGGTAGQDPAAWNRGEQVAYSAIRWLRDRIESHGWNSGEIQKQALAHAASKFKDPEDAAFMLDRFLRKAAPPPAPTQSRQPIAREQALLTNEQARLPGAPSRTDGEQTLAETPTQAATKLAAETPELPVIDGFDADGNPRYRPLSEAMADIDAERAQAAIDAQAFPAAVSCFMRRGV